MDPFEQAVKDVTKLVTSPTNEEKLIIYALYKQVTFGNVNTTQPYFYDIVGRSKWDAWNAQKDKSTEQAKQEYIEYVNGLIVKYGFASEV